MPMRKLFAAALIAALAVTPVTIATPALAQFLAAPPPGGGGGGGGGGHNPNDPRYGHNTYDCSDELGYLRRVYVSELAPVDDSTQVWVTPICDGEHVFRSEGNAGALRGAIAANDAMLAALGEKAFGPDDVVGVRMTGEDKVTLYVSDFHK